MPQWVSLGPNRGRALGRLFCLPFAGGGAAAFYPWTNRLLPDIELVRVHLPGRENRLRELPVTRVASLVNSLVAELVAYMDRPFAIYGHSMGALIAFELARELRRWHYPLPAHLFVSGFRAPHLPPVEPPFAHLTEVEFIHRVRQYGGIPDLVAQHEELMEIFLPILRADFEITETYVFEAEPPLEFPLTALGGLADPKVSCDRIRAWEMHTCRGFQSHFFPGGHFFIQSSEESVLDLINLTLAQSLMNP